MTDTELASQKLRMKQTLYEQYGKQLEDEHTGEYLAIGHDGRTILANRSSDVLKQALEEFGRGNFGVFRVGHETYAEWLLVG